MQLTDALCHKWELSKEVERQVSAMQRDRNQLQSIIDNTTSCISLKNNRGHYIMANRA